MLRLLQTFLRSAAIAYLANTASAAYTVQDSYDTSNFFNGFDFFYGPDPTHGFVDYVDAPTANLTSLAGYSGEAVYLGVDYTTVNPTGGRASVRLESTKQYTQGLFIADIEHMPGAECGVWPAFWTFGPNWPYSGEIDIIEGVNMQATNMMTLHTGYGCTMTNAGSKIGTVLATANCNAQNGFLGCGQETTNNNGFGTTFNAGGGGVYVLDWTSSAISIYFFPRNAIPADITAGKPNPGSWGPPQASFTGSSCDIDAHFKNHKIVFNTTFCGDWAGGVWDAQCSSKGATCDAYVSQNPAVFSEAYWLINSVKVYKQAGTEKRDVTAKSFMA